jgi:hypothetical protein
MKTSAMLVKMRYGFRSLWRTKVEEPIETGSHKHHVVVIDNEGCGLLFPCKETTRLC